MAAIVELEYPDNVTLIKGAVQNWRDLVYPLPSGSPAVRELIATQSGGSTLLVGPHDLDLVRALASRSDRLTMVVRAVVDAADMAEAAPESTVLCGDVTDADLDTYDLVVALNDLALVQSPERPTQSWRALADRLVAAVNTGGTVVLGVENERGDHRFRDGADPYVLDRDRDWTPFATWDESRPRTFQQVRAWCDAQAGPTTIVGLTSTWHRPSVAAVGIDDPAVARAGGLLSALDPAGSVLAVRSTALADRAADAVAGWVVVTGGEPVTEVISTAGLGSGDDVQRWTVEGSRLGDGRREVAIPSPATTYLVPVVEALIDQDAERLRSLLRRWTHDVEASCVGGVVPAALADVRLANLVDDGTRLVPLHAGLFGRLPHEAMWEALSDLMRIVVEQGLPTPWPNSMTAETRLATLGAMAGLTAPEDLSDLVPAPGDAGQSRAELLAVIKRQRSELAIAWSRFRWDEREYATYKVGKAVKTRARKVLGKGAGAARRARGVARSLRG